MSARSAIQTLRITALIEGLSWLVLLATMIYREMTHHHEPVSWAGRAHGGLFCVFALSLYLAWQEARWTLTFTALVGLSALIPMGFLFADPYLKKKLAIAPHR